MTYKTLKNIITNFRSDHNKLVLWWIGQSGFLVKWGTLYILIDPYLSDSVTKLHEGTDRPHKRMERIVIDPEEFNMINTIFY